MDILRPWWKTSPTVDAKGNPSHLIVVFALSKGRFQEWCKGHGINSRSRKVLWGRNGNSIRGMSCYWYVWLGTESRELNQWHRMKLLETTAFARELEI